MLRKALKISRLLPLASREVPRFHGGSLWHSTPEVSTAQASPCGRATATLKTTPAMILSIYLKERREITGVLMNFTVYAMSKLALLKKSMHHANNFRVDVNDINFDTNAISLPICK